MTNHRELTGRQRRFAREYLVDLNATRAAMRAGYSPNGAGTRGALLRHNPAVAARIDAALAAEARVAGITAQRVLRELALLGFANIKDYFETDGDGAGGAGGLDPARLTRDQAAAIAALRIEEGVAARGTAGGGGARRVTIRLADKTRSLKLLGRHLGLFARPPAGGSPRDEAAAGGAVGELSGIELARGILGTLGLGGRDGRRKKKGPAPLGGRPGRT